MANDTRVCILIDTHIDTGCTEFEARKKEFEAHTKYRPI
jgi:hypothetical protein